MQKQINYILKKFELLEFAKAFINNIVIFSKIFNKHLYYLKTIFITFN